MLAAALLILAGLGASSALEIGAPAGPVELVALDGRPLTMNNYAERSGTLVLFLSARSDAVEEAVEEINRLHKLFRRREVLFVGVAANPEESGDELRIYAQRRGMNFPFYRDPSGSVAQRFGATVTPEAFLLDKSGALLYRGALAGLEPAINALLEGKPVPVAEQKAEGTPIEARTPHREIEDPYGLPAFSSELVFERIPDAPAHHCSTLAEAANGDLLCVWYGGSYESAEDQVLFLTRRKKGERAWSEPQVLLRNPGQPPGNAVIFRDGTERLWLVWGRMESTRPLRRGAGWGQCRLFSRTSDDNGFTWSDDREWPDSLGQLPRNIPIILESGELLLPLTETAQGETGLFMITKDHGETWERSAAIAGGSQPTLAQLSDGSLVTYLRESPRLIRSTSQDGGRTWSAAEKTDIPNPNAGIAMTRLTNGHLLLVFNDTETDRTPLSVMRSVDDGRTWETPMKLEANPGEYSYPCVMQTSDGRIHISYTFRRYTIKHVEMNEDWLTHTERPN